MFTRTGIVIGINAELQAVSLINGASLPPGFKFIILYGSEKVKSAFIIAEEKFCGEIGRPFPRHYVGRLDIGTPVKRYDFRSRSEVPCFPIPDAIAEYDRIEFLKVNILKKHSSVIHHFERII